MEYIFKDLLAIIRISLGVVFIVIGIIGFFLPILPGIIFFLIGGSLVGWKGINKIIRRIKNKMRLK